MAAGAEVSRTHGDYKLSGTSGELLRLLKGHDLVAGVIRCPRRDGWWHDENAPSCAEAVVLPTCKSALLALTAGDMDAASALLVLLPGHQGDAR